ncbi:MAG: gamma-glutamyl-gamma-aminobutyrate hydrolase family protein [Bacteroidales bacterium]|nr:gamma-glutamyl-gamma-aminobutyrate hydrolase family protein [Bacteroidales bacterium]MCF8391011.1 gamma-glutamyl-gamma-aminobutyrate hydrolase family protein [Bacteroidales bacterium]
MKTILSILAAFLFISSSFSQDYFNQKENQHKDHLLIVHPSLSNMSRYDFLIKNGIIDPKGMSIVGLYFEDEADNYQSVIDSFPDYGFYAIPSGLEPTKIYSKNSLSDEFYKVFKYSSGIIFNGGPDIPPSTYGEEMMTLSSVPDPWRHYYELSLLFHLVGGSQDPEFKAFLKEDPDYLILGICLGLQTMNVASGGSLIQDIPLEIYGKNTVEEILAMPENSRHRNYYTNYSLHPQIHSYFPHQIKILPDNHLNSINEKSQFLPYVLSSHHQSIEELGSGYKATAYSMDGKVIEGIQHLEFPNVIGIQFHPEIEYLYQEGAFIKLKPEEETFSLYQKIKELDSYNFHSQLWAVIMNLL